MATFNFEDGLFPSTWKNSEFEPWQVTTEDANGGTQSLSANSSAGDLQISTCLIIGDFVAGDFDCDYKVSSEGGFDYGYIVIDGTVVVNQVSGAGSWTAMPTQTLTAGVHCIQFAFIKDGSAASGTDTFYIDNVVTPSFTDVKDDADLLTVGSTIFTNDTTNAWVAGSGGSNNIPINGSISPTSGIGTRSWTYTSPSSSPAGECVFVGFATASGETLKFFVDGVEKASDTGPFYTGSPSTQRPPKCYQQAVTSGSHDYELRASVGAAARAYVFYEPSLTAASSGATGKSNPFSGPFGGPFSGVIA